MVLSIFITAFVIIICGFIDTATIKDSFVPFHCSKAPLTGAHNISGPMRESRCQSASQHCLIQTAGERSGPCEIMCFVCAVQDVLVDPVRVAQIRVTTCLVRNMKCLLVNPLRGVRIEILICWCVEESNSHVEAVRGPGPRGHLLRTKHATY